MLLKKQRRSKKYLEELADVINQVTLRATHNDRMMYETLIREFPELKDKVLLHDVDGVGLAFPPELGRMKWRSLEDVYYYHLPEINRRADQRAYEKVLNEYVDGDTNISN